MRAVVNERYGPPDVLEIREVPTPKPGHGEVLVRVHAATVNRTDACALRAHPWFMRPATGWLRPRRKVLGLDFAGTVEAVGAGVERFAPGERVFGLTPGGYGAHADFVAVPEDGMIASLSASVPFSEAVVGEGAWYAHSYLERFALGPGQRILVYGASGAIGTAAVQLARIRGAEVTAVVSTPHLELARSLGAGRVVDYTTEDFTALGPEHDFVLDAVGKTSYFRCRSLLAPKGVYSATDLGRFGQNVFLSLWSWLTRSGRVVFPTPKDDAPFVAALADHLASGAFRAVVDRHYALEDIVDAYRYVETERKVGIVVIDVAEESGGAPLSPPSAPPSAAP